MQGDGALNDLKLIDIITGIVGFIREAGYLGIAVGFFVTLYKEMLFLGKDVKPMKEENTKLRAEVREANLTIKTLTTIIDRQSFGWERTSSRRLHVVDGNEEEEHSDVPPVDPSASRSRDRRGINRGRPDGGSERRRAESDHGESESGRGPEKGRSA